MLFLGTRARIPERFRCFVIFSNNTSRFISNRYDRLARAYFLSRCSPVNSSIRLVNLGGFEMVRRKSVNLTRAMSHMKRHQIKERQRYVCLQ